MIIVRVSQQVILFLSMYMTLYYWGNDVFVEFNKVLFCLVISTSLIQPVIDSIWKDRVGLRSALFGVSFFYSFIVIIVAIINYEGAVLAVIYLYLKSIEKLFHIYSCINENVKKAHLKLLTVYMFDFLCLLCVVLLSENFNIQNRLLATLLGYSSLLYVYKKVLRSILSKKIRKGTFWESYKYGFNVLFYFFLSTLLVNADRLYIEYFFSNSNRVSSYLLFLSIFSALFGLFSFNFELLRVKIRNKEAISFFKLILPYIFSSLILIFILFVVNFNFEFILEFFKIKIVDFNDVVGLCILYLSLFLLMMISTAYIQNGKVDYVIKVFFSTALIKSVTVVLGGILASNLTTSMFMLMMFILMYKKTILFFR